MDPAYDLVVRGGLIYDGQGGEAFEGDVAVKDGLIVLAFCWAHVRRDFLETARSWPTQEEWALGWVARIGQLYQAKARLEVFDQPEAFAAYADARQGADQR